MRIIIPKYKSWLATAALVTILTAFFANVPLAAPMTKAEPAVIQQQTPQRWDAVDHCHPDRPG